MADKTSTIPAEWRDAAGKVVKAISISRALMRTQCSDSVSDELLPALVLSITMSRARADICNRIEGVCDAAEGVREPMLAERLWNIEQALASLARSGLDMVALVGQAGARK